MPQVSIVVPVYNSASYLEKCLDSLMNQTLQDIEVIAVNNGSTDDSQRILDKYCQEYPRKMQSHRIDIADLSEARNVGLSFAKGEYVGYVDSDDYVHETMYEKLLSKALQGDFDMVVCDFYFEYPQKRMYIHAGLKEDAFLLRDIKKSMRTLQPSAWNKLYKRQLLEQGVVFKPGIWHEDVEFIYRLFSKIRSIGVVQEGLYYYIQREGSITHSSERLMQYLANFESILAYYREQGCYEAFAKELEYQYVRYLYASTVKRLAKTKDPVLFNQGVDRVIEAVQSRFPYYKRNKIFYQQGAKGLYLLLFSKPLAKIFFRLQARKKEDIY